MARPSLLDFLQDIKRSIERIPLGWCGISVRCDVKVDNERKQLVEPDAWSVADEILHGVVKC